MLARLRASSLRIPPERLGAIGKDCWRSYPGYSREFNTFTNQAGAHIPYIVEAWATASRPEQKGDTDVKISLLLNRSMTVAEISAFSMPGKIGLEGCDLSRYVRGPTAGNYSIALSVIAPHIQLTSDGKAPSLAPFSEAITQVLAKACGAAGRAMSRPTKPMTIKQAAYTVMPEAYRLASGNNAYPANARQITYAARPDILRLTGSDTLSDTYFTKTLLPDYLAEHP